MGTMTKFQVHCYKNLMYYVALQLSKLVRNLRIICYSAISMFTFCLQCRLTGVCVFPYSYMLTQLNVPHCYITTQCIRYTWRHQFWSSSTESQLSIIIRTKRQILELSPISYVLNANSQINPRICDSYSSGGYKNW